MHSRITTGSLKYIHSPHRSISGINPYVLPCPKPFLSDELMKTNQYEVTEMKIMAAL